MAPPVIAANWGPSGDRADTHGGPAASLRQPILPKAPGEGASCHASEHLSVARLGPMESHLQATGLP